MKNTMENLITVVSAKEISDDCWKQKDIPLMHECTLDVYVNGSLYCRQFVSPLDLKEFVIGRLVADGMIHSLENIQSLQLSTETMTAHVTILPSERTDSCKQIIPDWKADWLVRLSHALQYETPLYAMCENTHSCFLMKDGCILKCMEDIGRHNALDKIIGWATLSHISLEDCIIFTSGRVPKDMVAKVIRIGVKILASKALPTEEAVQMAMEHGLILLHISKRLGILRFS